jgi:PKD repeat protein
MTPGFYIITPHSPWSNKKTKQQELRERQDEEALLARLMCEAQQQQNSANGESAAVGANFSDYKYFHPTMNVSLGATPLTADGPLTVTFVNNSDPSLAQYGTFVLTLGDGFISSEPNISYLYLNTGSYTASLTGTSNYNGETATSTEVYISASIPTVTAAFTYVTESGAAPTTVTFTNTTINTSQTPTTTYKWLFGNNGAISSEGNPVYVYPTGSFTASLQSTGSYGIKSFYTQSFYVPAPTLVAGFTYTTSSGPGPISASFVDTSTYNGHGTKQYKFVFGDGITSSYSSISGLLSREIHSYANTGSFTASLQVTESSYNITSSNTVKFYVPAPTLTTTITLSTSSNAAPSIATFTNLPAYNGHGTLTYLWNLGSGSLTSTSIIPNPTTYTVAGPYTASLQITESSYNITTFVTRSWRLE